MHEIVLVLCGLQFAIYGIPGITKRKLSVGIRGMESLFLENKSAQFVGLIYALTGISTVVIALLSWINGNWLTQSQLLMVWCIAIAIVIVMNIVATLFALDSDWLPGEMVTRSKHFIFRYFVYLGVFVLAFVGIALAGGFLFILFNIFDVITGSNTAQFIFLMIAVVGLYIFMPGASRTVPPLEKSKRKSKPKNEV